MGKHCGGAIFIDDRINTSDAPIVLTINRDAAPPGGESDRSGERTDRRQLEVPADGRGEGLARCIYTQRRILPWRSKQNIEAWLR